METVSSRNKLKGSQTDVEVVYDVFKGTSRYISPLIYYSCSKTACDVAVYIIMTIRRNQTSIKFTTTDLIKSDYVKSKSKAQLHNAVKELIDNGVIVRWREIESIPNREHISKSWFLLNPQLIKCVSCNKFKEQVELTVNCIENGENYIINEFSAIVYDFTKADNNINDSSHFNNSIKYIANDGRGDD